MYIGPPIIANAIKLVFRRKVEEVSAGDTNLKRSPADETPRVLDEQTADQHNKALFDEKGKLEKDKPPHQFYDKA